MNLTANMMGLSNAATPFGIKAMEEMQRLNKDKEKAYEISRRHLTRYTENIAFIRESYKEYFTGV